MFSPLISVDFKSTVKRSLRKIALLRQETLLFQLKFEIEPQKRSQVIPKSFPSPDHYKKKMLDVVYGWCVFI